MRELQWSEAYGTLTSPTQINRTVSDITELWQTSPIRDLLSLWSVTNSQNEPLNSDYEKFRALCDMMPDLEGHPVERYCRDILERYFACMLPMDAEHCDAIWRLTSDALLMHPLSVCDLLDPIAKKQYLLWTEDTIPSNLPCHVLPELVADRLLIQAVPDVKQWRSDAEEIAEHFSLCGGDRVFFALPDTFCFAAPDPYHVSLALARKVRVAADRDLLIAQLFRMMCEICLANGWGMHLQVGSCGDAAAQLLSYAEKSVGLPLIYWSTPVASTRDKLLAFGYLKHQNAVLPMLRLSDYPSDAELQAAISSYAARYPIGMLHFSYGTDLRMERTERERLLSILE